MTASIRRILATALTGLVLVIGFVGNFPATSAAAASHAISVPATFAITACGGGTDAKGNKYPTYTPSIDIGCRGKGNPIVDMTFAIIRWLSDGVGLVVIGSIIVGGIQYSSSRDNPQATAAAVKRLQSALIALLIFIFGYAILNYLIPGAILQ